MPPAIGLRERKKNELRNQLIATATRLFLENGYGNTTLEQIAEENLISPRTLLRHFESKEGLAIASIRSNLENFKSQMEGRDRSEDALGVWRQALAGNIDIYVNSKKIVDYHELVTSEPQLFGIVSSVQYEYAQLIAAAMAQDRGSTGQGTLDDRMFATMLVQSYQVVLDHWIEHNREGNLLELAMDEVDRLVKYFGGRVA